MAKLKFVCNKGVSILEILIAVAVIGIIFPPVFELLFYFTRPTPMANDTHSIFEHESVNKKYSCDDLLNNIEGDKITAKNIYLSRRTELGLSTSSTALVTGISFQEGALYISMNSSSTTEPDIYNIGTGRYIDIGPGIAALKQFGQYLIAANSGVKNQIQIIRKNDLTVSKTFIVPGSNSTTNPITKSFTIARGLLFIGTEKSVLPEIFVFDIESGNVVSSIETGYGVNDLYVLDNLLFVASPRDPEVEVFNITNIGRPKIISTYDAPLGSGNGKVFDVQDERLILGRTKGGNELLTLDVRSGVIGTSTEDDVNIESYAEYRIGWSIDKMAQFKDYLLVLTADPQKEIQIFKYKDDLTARQSRRVYTLVYSYNLPARATDFACSKNSLYITIESLSTPLVKLEF